MINRLVYIVAFGCLGTTTEVWFTAIGSASQQFSRSAAVDLALQGHSYVWMFFIYGSAGVLLPVCFPVVARFPLLVRLLIYMAGIFAVEYLTGWLLEATTGSCPWHYTSRWAIDGYIRLDYGPFWMLFGLVLETVYRKLAQWMPLATSPPADGG